MSEFEFFTPRAVENEQRNRFDPELVPQTQPAAFALAFGMQIFEDCVAGFGGQRDFALDFRVDGADFIFDYVFGKLNFFDFAFFFALVVFDKDEVECPTVFLHDGVAIFEDGGVIEFFIMRQINQQYVFFSFQHFVKAFDSAAVFGFYCREGDVKVNAFGKVVVKVIIVAGVAVIYHFGIEIIVLGRAVDEDHVFLVHEVFKVVEDVFHAGGKIAKGNPVKRAGITAQKIFAHITGGGTVITDTVNDVINFGCHQRALLQKVFVFHEINDGRIVDDAADFLEERHLFEAEFQLVGFIEFAFGIKLLIPAAPFRTDAFLRVILDAGVSFNDLAFKMFEVADVIMIEADVAGFDAVRVFDADAVVAVKNADIALGLMDDLGVGLGIDIEFVVNAERLGFIFREQAVAEQGGLEVVDIISRRHKVAEIEVEDIGLAAFGDIVFQVFGIGIPEFVGVGIDDPVGMVFLYGQFDHTVHPDAVHMRGAGFVNNIKDDAFFFVFFQKFAGAVGGIVVGDDIAVNAHVVMKQQVFFDDIDFIFADKGHNQLHLFIGAGLFGMELLQVFLLEFAALFFAGNKSAGQFNHAFIHLLPPLKKIFGNIILVYFNFFTSQEN